MDRCLTEHCFGPSFRCASLCNGARFCRDATTALGAPSLTGDDARIWRASLLAFSLADAVVKAVIKQIVSGNEDSYGRGDCRESVGASGYTANENEVMGRSTIVSDRCDAVRGVSVFDVMLQRYISVETNAVTLWLSAALLPMAGYSVTDRRGKQLAVPGMIVREGLK